MLSARTRNLNVFYGAIHALRDVSLTVNAGEVVTLIGANGAGKSTTLRAITGLLKPSEWTGYFRGRGHYRPAGRTLGGRTRHLDVAGGSRHLREPDSSRKSAKWARTWEGPCPDTERLEHSFALFPRLKERMKQRAGTLSGGEQQMLAIARALMSHPKLLLLDEPSLGLAPLVCQTIFSTIDEIKAAGTTVLLVEQNASAALKHSDRGFVLETGEVILEGTASTIAGNPRVREAYRGIVVSRQSSVVRERVARQAPPPEAVPSIVLPFTRPVVLSSAGLETDLIPPQPAV